jgi:invasion protein IalB
MMQSSPNGRVRIALRGAFRAVGAMALVVMSFTTVASSASAASRTEKTFGKWAVVCVEPDNADKSCAMIQSHVQVDKQNNKRRPILRWTISTNKNHEQTQSMIVPTGVSIKEGTRLFLGDAEPIVIAYSFCGPRVCAASAPFDAKALTAVKASKKASASYVLGSKKLVQVELDLTGFTEAYDFLVKQLS